jgi:FtsZ-interacting cell division protein ZipA
MSELQQALLVIGLSVIVVVYGYGWWQQRSYRKKFGATFKAAQTDALYEQPPVVVSDAAEPKAPLVLVPETADDDVIVSLSTAQEVVPSVPHDVLDESCALLDVSSDFVITLELAEPSPAAVLDGFWQRKFDFGKPVHVCGMLLSTQQWERVIADSPTLYARFRIALQLVDRSGSVSLVKLGDFRDLVAGVAEQIKAEYAHTDVQETQQRAQELDAFCASVDQMVGINLIPPGDRTIPASRIAQTAGLMGMSLEADGAFHLLGELGHSVFSLSNLDTSPFAVHTLEKSSSTALTLLLDVPRTRTPAVQFDRMVQAAHDLARELQMNVVDDHRVVLTEKGIGRIRTQINNIDAQMREQGITPGSAQARRLFA